MHCKGAHSGLKCECPRKCFNCHKAGKPDAGHSALDDECPLKKRLRPISEIAQPGFFASKYPHAVTAEPSGPTARIDEP